MFQYTKQFDEQYEYRGNDLGAVCAGAHTCFKIWAPFAEQVELCIYEEGDSAMHLDASSIPDNCRKYQMNKLPKGVFAMEFDSSLHGKFYDYLIHEGSEVTRTADPYATACSANGCRSAVVDLSLTNPAGFEDDKVPEKENENILYELHIKDFSYDKESGVPEEYRGKYKAFTVESKGLEHMKKLGITHVHLLPAYDFGWLDEKGEDMQFNWGYDPLNYNVPEGSFATDADNPVTRILEFKEMVQALHKAGIRVVMDVVYNHTYEADSWLERSAPGYFNRRWQDGTLANGSACGSDIAAGRAMADNYIVNSVLYWAREYHIDGFRFDLMGLLTTELMNRIKEELDREYGKGEKILYGEPWSASDSPMEEGTHAVQKCNVDKLDKDFAVFCDATRDVIKGDVFHSDWPGFVNGAEHLEADVLAAAKGWVTGKDEFHPVSCSQIVNYVSAHDNYTLWDKLIYTSEHDEYTVPFEDIMDQNKLAAFIYFTCQGHIFFQAGEEFGRSKLGDENSFRSAPEINMLHWSNEETFSELNSYYCGLIRLRKRLKGLYEKRDGKVFDETIHAPKIVSFRVKDGEKGELFIIYNASAEDKEIKLPEGEWELLADKNQADMSQKVKESICARACGGILLRKDI